MCNKAHIRIARSTNSALKNVLDAEGQRVRYLRVYANFDFTRKLNSTNALYISGDILARDVERTIQAALKALRVTQYVLAQ